MKKKNYHEYLDLVVCVVIIQLLRLLHVRTLDTMLGQVYEVNLDLHQPLCTRIYTYICKPVTRIT